MISIEDASDFFWCSLIIIFTTCFIIHVWRMEPRPKAQTAIQLKQGAVIQIR